MDKDVLVSEQDFDLQDNETNIIFEEGAPEKIKAGTFPKLISKLTSPKEVDTAFLYDFLLTYRSFATAQGLLNALIVRYKGASGAEARVVRLRVFNVLRQWAEKYWYDFSKDCPALFDTSTTFLEEILNDNSTDEGTKKVAATVKERIVRSMKGDAKAPQNFASQAYSRPFLPKDPVFSIWDVNPEEIARQLTLVEWKMWKEIQPWECLGLAWTKKDKDVRAPHLLQLIERFNYVSGWVATTMCTTEKPKDRVKILKTCLEIAKRLRLLSNFNGVLEIISGLNRAPVFRLKITTETLMQKDPKLFQMWEELKALTDSTKAYASLRRAIKEANPPCIPYLGMYLTDLTFIEEGNKDVLTEYELINFHKRRLISETIRELKTYQQNTYYLTEVPAIQEKLQGTTILGEPELYELSNYLEPRQGKERGPRPAALGGELPAAGSNSSNTSNSSAAGAKKAKKETTTGASASTTVKPELEFKKEWSTVFSIPDAPANINMNSTSQAIVSATLGKVIERLTHHTFPDNNLLLPFLAVFRTFTTPKELLDLLILRADLPEPKDKSEANLEKHKQDFEKPIFLRIFNLVKNWLVYHWYDFEDDTELKTKILDFIEGPLVKHTAANFVDNLRSILAENNQKEPEIDLPSVNPSHTLQAFEATEIAQQITLKMSKLLNKVRPTQLLKAAKCGVPAEVTTASLDALKSLEEHCHLWVAYELQKARTTPQVISQTITQLLSVAQQFLPLNNWIGLKAIIVVIEKFLDLGDENIKSAWNLVSTTDKQFYMDNKDLLLNVGNRKKLTEKMLGLIPPCVPLYYPFLWSLFETESQGGPDMLAGGLINMEKKKALGEILVKLIRMQTIYYKITPTNNNFLAYFLRSYTNTATANDGLSVTIFGTQKLCPEVTLTLPTGTLKTTSVPAGRSASGSESDSGKDAEPSDLESKAKSSGNITRKTTVQPATRSPHNSTTLPSGVVPGLNTSNNGINTNSNAPTPVDSAAAKAAVPPQVLSNIVKQSFAEMARGDDKFRAEILTICKEVITEELQKMRTELSVLSVKRNTTTAADNSKSALESIKDPQARELISKTFPGCLISTWTQNDITGAVTGKPGTPVSIDVIHYQDDKRWLLDLKEHVTAEDVANLLRVGKLYHQNNPKISLACVVVTASIDPKVAPILEKCKIKVLKLN